MKIITVSLSFYNQGEILKRHIADWKSFPTGLKDRLKFFVIDDCSETPATEVLAGQDLSGIDLNIYRVEEDIYCNMSGVKNLGAKECPTEWILHLDMDTMVSLAAASAMLERAGGSGPGVAYKFNRRVADTAHEKHHVPHPGVGLIRKDDYWQAGGCDEDFAGHYGFEDTDFWRKASGSIRLEECLDIYLDYIPEGNSDISRERKKNHKLFKSKTKPGKASTDYLRFPWKKVY